jgi:uncharacterized membrane protein
MALDHVRDFLYKSDASQAGAVALDPTNLKTTFPMLFATRWITHFCAPIFVLLAGTSIYLMSLRKTKSELSVFLIKRGLWLVFLEVVVVTFAWTFNPFYNLIFLQVIWAIGISMIILGLFVNFPYKIILATGIIIVAAHNLMDFPSISSGLKGSFFSDLVYFTNFSIHPLFQNHFALVIYAFLPWTGVMLLGYCFGKLFEPRVDEAKRRKVLIQLGSATLVFFVVLRLCNFYGDPVPWGIQSRGFIYTFLSFLNLTKYPPSLLFLCMTIGPGMLFLAYIEKIQNKFTDILNDYGKVPMMFYVLHFYLIHIIVVVVFYLQGFGTKDIISPNVPFFFKPNALGYGLLGIYVVWAIVVVALYPACKWYGKYKASHHQWWLSYL